jgi:anti-sigma factor RsiW
MARCDDIKLQLGLFEDGELEPHEMQEVARHVVGCADCELELRDYRTMAVGLRSAVTMPELSGFGAAVMARIEQLPIPFRLRVRRYLTSFRGGIGATLTTGFAAAVVAVVTAVVVSPYFKQTPFIQPRFAATSQAPVQVTGSAVPVFATPQDIVRADGSSAVPADVASSLSATSADLAAESENPDASGNSRAIISKLESDNPSVAVWTEPQSDTTVIWMPDQNR